MTTSVIYTLSAAICARALRTPSGATPLFRAMQSAQRVAPRMASVTASASVAMTDTVPTGATGQPVDLGLSDLPEPVNDGLLQAATAAARRRRDLERLRELGSHDLLDASNRDTRLVRDAAIADRGGGDQGGNLDGVEVHGALRQIRPADRPSLVQAPIPRSTGCGRGTCPGRDCPRRARTGSRTPSRRASPEGRRPRMVRRHPAHPTSGQGDGPEAFLVERPSRLSHGGHLHPRGQRYAASERVAIGPWSKPDLGRRPFLGQERSFGAGANVLRQRGLMRQSLLLYCCTVVDK
jgi:hypothetical protein